MIQRIIILLAFVATCTMLNGQFTDDFSDGNLDGWQGNILDFIVNASQQLQLNAPEGNTESVLFTHVDFADSMVWEMYIKLDFAPSTSNQLRVFLATSESQVTGNGYFLEIGASGDQDALLLKYKSGGNENVIAMSAAALVADQPVELNIRVKRTDDGTWTCHDISGAVPVLFFSAIDTTTPITAYHAFAIHCTYTDTRRDKFFFDNINIGPPQPDTSAPVWLDLTVIDPQTLALTFNEPIQSSAAQDNNNYLLSPGLGNPTLIELSPDRTTITLHWPTAFVSPQQYTLSIQQLRDDAGNIMAPMMRSFLYALTASALPNEILITEIMADPTPVIALPDAEYIELYNNTAHVFQLADYVLRVSSSERELPEALLLPGAYIILTDADHWAALNNYGTAIAIDNFPSLTNSGTTISLLNLGDELIHEVAYSDDWYRNPDKSDGGWSLEMINPNAICADGENWMASNDLKGGTPGMINSLWEVITDETGPTLLSLFPSTPTTLVLTFSEKLDGVLMENPALYQLQPAIGIADASLLDDRTIQLTLSQPLQPGVVYTLLPFDVYDCLGNQLTITFADDFGLIVDGQPGDILINEILFNPASGGSRFIEVINISDKFINLSTLAIGRLTMQQQDIYTTGIQAVLQPGGIAAFTPDHDDILARYTVPMPDQLYTATLPSWDEDTDNATILANGVVLDSFTYSADWHHPVIADENGVSIERVSIAAASSLAATWHSASSLSGYATPTGPNSQTLDGSENFGEAFSMENRIFSPNDDGFKDFLFIRFISPASDAITSAWIYDMEGRVIQQLANNELVGSTTVLQWDGRNAAGELADMGMYIVFVQLWQVDGDVKEFQASCALVKR